MIDRPYRNRSAIMRFGAWLSPGLVLLSACTTLPGQGPSAMDIALEKSEISEASGNYVIVQLNPEVLQSINYYANGFLPAEFISPLERNRNVVVGVADHLSVNIWEASPDGLFSTAEKKQTSLHVMVDEDGMIFIPYAGRIRAMGRNVEDLRKAIEEGLSGKAVEPQVQVLVDDNRSSNVVVVGDVAKPGQYPLSVGGLRLLEAIAQAGGSREALFESVAIITRGSRIATVRLEDVVSRPQNNVWLAPGDNVSVTHQPRTFSAFGAVRSSELVPFKVETLTLAEALAQVGGLRDATADAGGVFLFRYETADLARNLTADRPTHLRTVMSDRAPVIYRLDFKDPQAFFVARSFKMRDKDIIYVATHPTAEMGKFLNTIVSPIVGTARTVSSMGD